ncbi:FAD/FMN-containing dehydrogenase [Arthrobacter sp. V4I6]|uniref:FAD-binding oxidoreductase n=1 Tax=unclassified Arthrobacter TaxID=235627 RepID=UPI0027823F7F|nr:MULTISPECIES: FAD-binding oxidoreductase [unclassified Arthrobacter]MDQ0819308.1 FAD/FMN-containing dehydrogenase [Arthrobacter sp. V1I7]MDQ0853491.1 FAD/FMN-containing dehydrogenase [Arthrobacter sp. V4I6]
MKWIKPDSPDYDEARTLFNAMIDRRPAVIAQCSSPAEVAEALKYADVNSLDVAVRAGGHSVAGMSLNDGGLVVDVRPMKSVRVDPEARTATVGTGLTCGEFDRATQEHGLALTGGRVSTTGLAGFTLGGGSGWLERAFGFACDDLISVDLVTAAGEEVTASARENPELFWALHGGGGNFGVATSFTFGLHRLGPKVHAGLLMWPGDAAAEVSRAYRELALAAPNEESATLIYGIAPPESFVPPNMVGKMAVFVVYLYAGDAAEGAEHARAYRALGPAVDLVEDTGYADFQCSLDDPPGKYNYWSADYHDELSDAALDVIIDSAGSLPGPSSQQMIARWGGAVGGPAAAATPLLNRSASWVSHPFGLGDTPEGGQEAKAWVKRFRRDIAPYATGGVWLNFIGDEGQARIRAAYGDENYQRLARVKREFDPGNTFRGNQNILPAT